MIAISLIGVTYAFFDYYMLGANQKITAGKVNLTLNEGEDTIDRGNIFPETVTEARSRDDNFITFTVSGINTTEDQDIYYEIMLNEGDPETGMTRFNSKDLVFDLVELNDDGTEGTYLVNALSYNDFNERRIWVNTVSRDTELTVNKTYKLRMWLSDRVLISDSNPYADYKATGYENYYASVKVSVYGDFVDKQLPYNYMANLGTPEVVTETETIPATFWPETIETVKTNITEVKFISMKQDLIDARFESATIKEDLTVTSESSAMTPLATTIENTTYGSVKVWLENGETVTNDDSTVTQYYTMYVASDGMTFLPSDCTNMFNKFINAKSIIFENVSTKFVTNMKKFFQECISLTNLDISNFDTTNVTNMGGMFGGCKGLISLDLSNFNTSNVTTMSYMFNQCNSLEQLDLSNFDTSNITSMTYMFGSCKNLAELYISNFDTAQVTNMSYMFYDCNILHSLDLSNFNTELVTTMFAMFYSCSTLTELDLSSFDTKNVENMSSMFSGCSNLIELDVSNFNTSKVTGMKAMLKNCSSLTELDLTSFNVEAVTTTEQMFYYCFNLTTIYANSDWKINDTITSTNMFKGSAKLVGAISYHSTKINVNYANPTTGYFTKKEA